MGRGGPGGSRHCRVLRPLGAVSAPALQLHLDIVELPRGTGPGRRKSKLSEALGEPLWWASGTGKAPWLRLVARVLVGFCKGSGGRFT